MAEQELQHLIERIRREAIDDAEKKAETIVSGARDKAAARLKETEAKAETILRKAEEDAKVFVHRSRRTLEQAARDLLITVGQGVENILSDIVEGALEETLDDDLFRSMLVKIAEAYAERDGNESRIEVLVSEKDREQLVQFFAGRYRDSLAKGVEIHSDNKILKGFRVSVTDGRVQHDFTPEAMAEALSAFLRPHLSEIVHRAARGAAGEQEKNPENGDGAKG
jgi:V/A-type H+/Na+-transporting ATPase subunit E